MIYTSTVTSKGTITLPASIRSKLGIMPGKEVNIELRGSSVIVRPKGGWEDVMAVGEKMRNDLKKRGGTVPASDEEFKKQVDAIKTIEYRKKYVSGADGDES